MCVRVCVRAILSLAAELSQHVFTTLERFPSLINIDKVSNSCGVLIHTYMHTYIHIYIYIYVCVLLLLSTATLEEEVRVSGYTDYLVLLKKQPWSDITDIYGYCQY